MEFDYKAVLGASAVVIAVVSYIPYFRDIFAGKTKPHAFTWLVWAILNGIAFAGQVHDDAGAGSWAVGFTALALFSIFLISLWKGEKNIRPFDWFCLISALLALIPWLLSSDPLLSIILITVIDTIGFLPTVRKSFNKPHQETLITYELSTLKYLLVIIALHQYTLVTVLFPLVMVVMNGLFVILLVIRRKQLKV